MADSILHQQLRPDTLIVRHRHVIARVGKDAESQELHCEPKFLRPNQRIWAPGKPWRRGRCDGILKRFLWMRWIQDTKTSTFWCHYHWPIHSRPSTRLYRHSSSGAVIDFASKTAGHSTGKPMHWLAAVFTRAYWASFDNWLRGIRHYECQFRMGHGRKTMPILWSSEAPSVIRRPRFAIHEAALSTLGIGLSQALIGG